MRERAVESIMIKAEFPFGVLMFKVKQLSAGITYFKAALEADPNQGKCFRSYIGALIQTGHGDASR